MENAEMKNAERESRSGSTAAEMPFQIDLTLKGAEEATQSLYFEDEDSQTRAADQLHAAWRAEDATLVKANDAFGSILVQTDDIAAIRSLNRARYRDFVEAESLEFLGQAAGVRRQAERQADFLGLSIPPTARADELREARSV